MTLGKRDVHALISYYVTLSKRFHQKDELIILKAQPLEQVIAARLYQTGQILWKGIFPVKVAQLFELQKSVCTTVNANALSIANEAMLKNFLEMKKKG